VGVNKSVSSPLCLSGSGGKKNPVSREGVGREGEKPCGV
jgi:hypothetical protein